MKKIFSIAIIFSVIIVSLAFSTGSTTILKPIRNQAQINLVLDGRGEGVALDDKVSW